MKKKAKAGSDDRTAEPATKPFDTWLKRGLHQLYDDVANEPIPDALLDLIEQDRKKGDPGETGGEPDK
jgi:hypothetical protein